MVQTKNMDSTDQPNSICHVDPTDMYPVPTEQEKANLPFNLLYGENVKLSGSTVDGLLVLTNFRLYIQLCDSQLHVPLGLIELVEQRELFHLHISCKDARSYRCTFDNNETCLEWFSELTKASTQPRQLEATFACCHYYWSKECGGIDFSRKIDTQKSLLFDEVAFKCEFDRLKFESNGAWRITSVNSQYKLCPSYPPALVVPSCITDATLEIVAKFRSSRRIPAVVWRHTGNGAVIARCSQPEVGWLGWRSSEDEQLLKALADGCSYDVGPEMSTDKEANIMHSPGSVHSEDSGQTQAVCEILEKKKVLIMDARSYTTAVANRARGGGCECPEYYPCCEIVFMNLANIHSIRKSFHGLRQLCTSSADQPNWYSLLEGTRWLQHMSGVMRAAVTLVNAVETEARPVLVHCSDGWDRTPQIVALGELLLDPYYRTVDGFRILIEREWLAFGHKFADRCGQATGSDDINERCPVFLQWLDCVHQLLVQFPCSFEFSHTYLVKLAQHTYSNLFGTFLCNTKQDRVERVNESTFSVWSFLGSPCFRNHLYAPIKLDSPQVLWPQCNVRDLRLWSEVYLGSLERRTTVEGGSNSCPGPPDLISQHMTKTRSYGDLPNAADIGQINYRRCSDPSIAVDSIKIGSLTANEKTQNEGVVQVEEGDDHKSLNGCSIITANDFLSSDLDEIDCKSDCLYKDDATEVSPKATDADECGFGVAHDPFLIDENDVAANDSDDVVAAPHMSGDFSTHGVNVIDNEKTELARDTFEYTEGDVELRPHGTLSEIGNFESICLNSRPEMATNGGGLATSANGVAKGDINHNGEVKGDDVDSDTECTDPSESKSENTVCDVRKVDVLKSIETSTETLVPEMVVNRLPKTVNGVEKFSSPDVYNGNSDTCKTCINNRKVINCKHSGSTSGKTSRYSTPPLYSRTPSTNGWDNTLMYFGQQQKYYQCSLGDDGLVPLRSEQQERLWQILEEHRKKEETLRRELQTYRQALIDQVCHKCNRNDLDRNDDTWSDGSHDSPHHSSDIEFERSNSLSPIQLPSPVQEMGSVVESVCSAGEGPTSAVESLRSDMSWEAVDEGSALAEGTPTLWVPDHAVSICTGCKTTFWLGRRKHHCRNCGRIFCADCSENSTPLPSEHLFEPVRVCTSCFSKLRRDCGEFPEQCKHNASQATNNNPQIAASSN